METKDLMDVNELSAMTGIAVGTLYHWVSEKRIPYIRLSAHCVRFSRAAINAWLAQKAVVPADRNQRWRPVIKQSRTTTERQK